MNQDFFQSDMLNKYSNESFSVDSDIFNDINYDSLNNLKNYSSQNIVSQNNFYHLGSSIINFKNENESKIESDKEIEKDSSISNDFDNNMNNNQCFYNNYILNINNNFIINNYSNNNNNCCNCNNNKYSQYIPFNDKSLSYEDIFVNTSINFENSLFNNNSIFITKINNNNKSININNKEIKKNNNDKDNKTKLNNNEKLNKHKNEQKINVNIEEEELPINENINEKKDNKVINLAKKENSNICNPKINLNIKRKIKKKKNENKTNNVIQYGHPKKRFFKTMKQKLNLHKKLDPECRNDTILIIYTLSKLKNIIKSLETSNKIKNKNSFERMKTLYKNYIINLQHKEYAQNIIGYNLI